MKGSAKERRELHFRMLENEKINEDARKRLREVIGSGISLAAAERTRIAIATAARVNTILIRFLVVMLFLLLNEVNHFIHFIISIIALAKASLISTKHSALPAGTRKEITSSCSMPCFLIHKVNRINSRLCLTATFLLTQSSGADFTIASLSSGGSFCSSSHTVRCP